MYTMTMENSTNNIYEAAKEYATSGLPKSIEAAFFAGANYAYKHPIMIDDIRDIQANEFEVGDYVFATWDETPVLVEKKDEESYMIRRDGITKWLYFEDTLPSKKAIEKYPQFAYLYKKEEENKSTENQ